MYSEDLEKVIEKGLNRIADALKKQNEIMAGRPDLSGVIKKLMPAIEIFANYLTWEYEGPGQPACKTLLKIIAENVQVREPDGKIWAIIPPENVNLFVEILAAWKVKFNPDNGKIENPADTDV